VKWFSSTKGIALSIAVLGFIYGAVWVFFYRSDGEPETVAIFGILLTVAVFVWFREDATAHSFRRSPILNMAVIGLPIIAVPFYLFRSRGLKGGALATSVAFLIFAASIASSWLGSIVARLLRT
jgi:hypothetical protein